TRAGVVLLVTLAWRHQAGAAARVAAWVAWWGLVAAAVEVWWLWWNTARAAVIPPPVHPPMIAVDDFRFVADWLVLGTAALTVLVSFDYSGRESLLAPVCYVLLLFATVGMMLMAG